MAKVETAAKKKTASKKKLVSPKKVTVKKKAATKKKAAPKKAAKPAGPLVIELCAPGKRCKERLDGSFIRQDFISGRWEQVSTIPFPTLQACKNACDG